MTIKLTIAIMKMKRCSLLMLMFIQVTLVLLACGGKGPLPPSDTTRPSVISAVPVIGAQNVPVNSSVIITFSEPMDASTINEQTIVLSTGNSNVQGSVTYSGVTAIFKPASNLNPQTIYTVAVDASVKDASGNAMGTLFGYIFITGIDVLQDTMPPRVIDIQPSNRKTGISPNTVIVVMFSEPMDASTITNATIQVSSLGQPVPNTTVTLFGSAAIIKTNAGLASNTDYNVLVTTRVKDVEKNAMTDAFVATFRTGTVNDTSAPSVVIGSIIPTPDSTTISVDTPISVTFNKPMNVSTINRLNFIVSDGTSTISGNIQYYGMTAVFTPSTPLLSSTAYTAAIKNTVMDLSGNPMSVGYSWSFTTEPKAPDSIPPQVLSTEPTSTNVPVYRNVVVLFNETLLVSSITQTAFSLSDSQGKLVPGNTTSSGAVVFFTPVQPLAYNTTYTATMTTAATDIAGNPLASVYSWNFTTEAVASFTITPSTIGQGSISPSTPQIVSYSTGTTTFTITPAAGYHILDVLVDGVSVSAVTSYSFTGVTADHTISAKFANTYTITATAGTNGGISPSGLMTLNFGTAQPFTITPATGYHVADVLVDGVSVGAQTSYTFTNLNANHTINASFASNTYTVTPSVFGGNGSISPSSIQSVNYGSTTIFTLTPSAHYHAVMGGTCAGTLVGNTYTTSPVMATCTVIASFAIDTNTIATSVSSGIGTVSPANPSVNYNASQMFTITPGTGYHVADVLVDGASVGAVTTYTFNNVTAVHTISAIFEINTNTIMASVGAGGSVTPSGSVIVNYGADQTFTFTPNTGYHVSAVLVDNVDKGLISSYTFTNVTASHTIAVSFLNNMYQITVTATPVAGGTITPGTSLVPYGGNQSFTFQANTGYQMTSVLADGYSVGAVTSYPFTNVQSDHALEVRFSPILTVNASGTGSGTVGGAGTYSYGLTAQPTAVANTDSTFTGWSGDCSGTASPTSVLMNSSKTCTATFTLDTYSLTINASGTGSGTITGAGTYGYGTTANPNAVANTGSTFTGWSGDCSGTASPTSVLMNSPKTCTATFTLNTYVLTVNASGTGSGTITGAGTYSYGTIANPNAVANTGSTFTGWSGDCSGTVGPTSVLMNADRTCTATFTLNTYTLTVNASGTGSGTITGAGTYSYDTTANPTAVADTGSTFTGWSGDCSGTASPTSVLMNADRTCTATFTLSTYTLTVNASGTGNGTVGGAGTYNYGTIAQPTAVAHHGYTFTGWSGDCSGTSSPASVLMDADKTCTAIFN